MGKRPGFDPNRTWTVALAGHRSAGKTTLAEHLLRTTGVVRRPGKVESGTALLDFEQDERRKHRSRRNAYAWMTWQGHRIELVDVPGMTDAVGDQTAALDAVDAVLLVVDAGAGLEVGSQYVLAGARKRGLPVVVVLTKADRARDLGRAHSEVLAALGDAAVAIQLPLTDHDGRFCGVVDPISAVAQRYADDETGERSIEPLSETDAARVARAREQLWESVASTNDLLLESYLEWFELSEEQFGEGLRSAVLAGQRIPVLLASGLRGVGGAAVLDVVGRWLPPAGGVRARAIDRDGASIGVDPHGAFVARLVSRHLTEDGAPYGVFRVHGGAVPRSGTWRSERGHQVKVRRVYQLRGARRSVLNDGGAGAIVAVWAAVPGEIGDTWGDGSVRLHREPVATPVERWTLRAEPDDPGARENLRKAVAQEACLDATIRVELESWPLEIAGVSDSHLGRAVGRITRTTGLHLVKSIAPVKYLETPARPATGVEGLHVREGNLGLVEEFGACVVDLEPGAPLDGNSWGESLGPNEAEELPERWRPAIYEGVQRGLTKGPSGYPVVGAAIRLVGGRYDILSSTEEHFVSAGEEAIRRALERSGTAVLEPWTLLSVHTPADRVGDLIARVSNSRGRVVGVEGQDGSTTVLRALVPERELRSLEEHIRSATHGRGSSTRRHSHYEPLPRHLQPDSTERHRTRIDGLPSSPGTGLR